MIQTDTELIAAVTERDLKVFEDEYDDKETADAVRKLKIGESYDADS